jgi:ribosomal protein S18 acetylase RimI-like enzyme
MAEAVTCEPWHDSSLTPEIKPVDVLAQPYLDQVMAIEQEAFPPCERLGPHLMQQQTSLRTSGLLLAEMSASVCGFLLYSRTGGAGLITKLAVSAAFRRRGIGSALLRRGILELERPARRPPASEIQLHVDPARTEARQLYESYGFERVSLLTHYYTDARDALLMRRVSSSVASK